ncbi:helix-turn-helix transcriptional regulator [Lysobacter sp. A421]
MSGLHRFGATQQKLLRALLPAGQGLGVEELCKPLRISHNAVRQHLTALLAGGFVCHGVARASGGRPQARYLLTMAGRELFPRNYGLIATKVLERLYTDAGPAQVQTMLVEMGRELGHQAAATDTANDTGDAAKTLAQQLDALGYEAQAIRRDGEMQVEAYNCVFHELARNHPEVCRFDIAFMEAASGHQVQHLECLVRGGDACRFRLGAAVEHDTASGDHDQ